MLELKDKLKEYRENKKISQEDMAREIGCSVFSYINWERRGKKISRAWEIILREKKIIE